MTVPPAGPPPPSPQPPPEAAHEPSAARQAASGSIFVYSGFNKLFFGSLTGKLADRLYQSAMAAAAFVVFAGASSENQLAYIQIVATVPLLAAYSLSSALVDIADRRRLMWSLMAVKGVIVAGFLPLLWRVTAHADAAAFAFVRAYWYGGLALIFVLSVVDAPFGPARAAAVPDVAPLEHRRLGASLMAASGLIALLLGSMLGFYTAQTRHLGPANTIILAAGFYVVSVALLSFLPDAVAVPGNKRLQPPGPPQGGRKSMSWREYFRELGGGFSYVCRTRGLVELAVFETAFWCIGSIYYLLFAWHLDVALRLCPDDKTLAFGWVLGAAGVGLFIGAVSAGRLSKTVTPLLTYPLALLIMAVGTGMTFSSQGAWERVPGPQAEFHQGDWAELAAPGGTAPAAMRVYAPEGLPPGSATVPVRGGPFVSAAPRADLILVRGVLSQRLLALLCLAGMLAGLGGGLFLGRVDADVLSIADEQMRGRVFSVKGTGFAFALLGTMGALALSGDETKLPLAAGLAAGLVVGALAAFVMAWRVDMAIWMPKGATEPPRGLHRAGYLLARWLLRRLLKLFFRYEVVGGEHIPAGGPVILAANHASFLDPIFLGCCTERVVQYTMHADYYRSFAHPVFRFLRCISVDEKSTLAALKANVRSLGAGACVGVFPEGHVSDDGRLQPAKEGALFLAQHSGAPIVPVALKGNSAILPRGARLPRCAKLKVLIGEPFFVAKDASREELAVLSEKLMATLAAALELEPPSKNVAK